MRIRLILSYALIILITTLSLVVIVRMNTAEAVRNFMFRGGAAGVAPLVEELESYYQEMGSWQGVGRTISTTQHGNSGRGAGAGGQGTGNNSGGNTQSQRLRLLNPDGTVVFDTDGTWANEIATSEELQRAIPLHNDIQTIGYLLTEGGAQFTTDNETQLVEQLNRAALIAALIAGGVALLLALLLAHNLLRPVRDLTHAAADMAEGDLSQRVKLQGAGEWVTLGQAFNHMAFSLEQAEDRRRALTADIAHELRTPLAVQRAHLEALQDGIYELTQENLLPIEAQTQILTRLVDDLKTLALADSGQLALERVPVDFPGLVARLVNRFQPQAGARQIELRLTLDVDSANLMVDPQRIEQILNNLLSNALRYATGGSIRVRLARTSERVMLSVHDSGPGIPEDSLPHIFERFYKTEKSRRSAYGSTGLGLSIARKLAQAHGGDLTAANHPQGGALFTLELPL
ncbi:MAG: HAMP domain-containing protein [Anaerolineae bacterium]|nr:HAMP domain-containing protein [Anaerolineae bacterium]